VQVTEKLSMAVNVNCEMNSVAATLYSGHVEWFVIAEIVSIQICSYWVIRFVFF
jgi:hypothetical protein